MSVTARERVASYLAVEGRPVVLREHAVEPSAALGRLVALAPWLSLELVPTRPDSLPLLDIRGSRPHGPIRFVGTVEGRPLEALVVLLRSLATGEVDWETPASPQLLAELRYDRSLELFVGPSCPFCPALMAAGLRTAMYPGPSRVAVTIVRADELSHPEVRSVPTLLLDGRVVHVGALAEYDLAQLLVVS